MAGKKIPLEKRFAQFHKPDQNGCWIWHGVNNGHYGQIHIYVGKFEEYKLIGAHRASWMLFRGPIPERLNVLHSCDVRLCVNPDHLFLGTDSDNMQDMVSKNRQNWPLGEDHYLAKLTEDSVRFIKQSTESNSSLGERFGVHGSTINCIRKEKSWRWVKV